MARSAEILGAEDGLFAVRDYVNLTATGLAGTTRRQGCLMFNTCMQVAPHDAAVETQGDAGHQGLATPFRGGPAPRGRAEDASR